MLIEIELSEGEIDTLENIYKKGIMHEEDAENLIHLLIADCANCIGE